LYLEEAEIVRETKSLQFYLNGSLPDGYAEKSELRLRVIEIHRKILETRQAELLAEVQEARLREQWEVNLATSRSANRAAWFAGVAAAISCVVAASAAWVQAHTPPPSVTVAPQLVPPQIVVSPSQPEIHVHVAKARR
jgi:hypothetical protein